MPRHFLELAHLLAVRVVSAHKRGQAQAERIILDSNAYPKGDEHNFSNTPIAGNRKDTSSKSATPPENTKKSNEDD